LRLTASLTHETCLLKGALDARSFENFGNVTLLSSSDVEIVWSHSLLAPRPFVTMATSSLVAPALVARAPLRTRVPTKPAAATATQVVVPRIANKRSLGVGGCTAAVRRGAVQTRALNDSNAVHGRSFGSLETTKHKHTAATTLALAMSTREVTACALFAAFTLAFFAADPTLAATMDGADGLNNYDTLNNLDSITSSNSQHELFSVAGSEIPFWANMVKYARFSISIMVGFVFMFGRPVVNLLKKPQTAALVLGGGFFGFKFFKFTIETMLGLNDDMTMNF
jgi:hypothetical protein